MNKEKNIYQREVTLFIQNSCQKSFMVYPYIDPISGRRKKWCLPTGQIAGDPDNTLAEAKRLAFDYYSIDIKPANLINYFVELDDYVCLVTNRESTQAIEGLFEQTYSGYRKHYTSMSIEQAPLVQSGLDSTQKQLLTRAGLIKELSNPVRDPGKNVFSFQSKRNRLINFRPKPL
jgi:hypothetical protein